MSEARSVGEDYAGTSAQIEYSVFAEQALRAVCTLRNIFSNQTLMPVGNFNKHEMMNKGRCKEPLFKDRVWKPESKALSNG